MRIRKKLILNIGIIWFIVCFVCLFLVSCIKSRSEPGIGMATHWTMRKYGMILEKCVLTGPAYGNETQMYVQGTSLFEGKTLSAYLIVELKNGRTMSWGKPQQGEIPSAIISEYDEVISPLEKMHTNYAQGDRGYHRSWKPPSPFSAGGIRNLFYHIMKQTDINNEVSLHCGKEYRSVSARFYFPFIYIGALVIDFVTAPLQFALLIMVANMLSGFRH